MPNKPTIILTEEAKAVLEAAKRERQGYTECLLASEAIIEKYGRPRHSMGPVNAPVGHYTGDSLLNPIPSGEEIKIAAKLLLKCGGVAERAIGKLDNTKPNYAKIATAIFELAGGEV